LKLKIPYLLATVLATASLLHLTDNTGLSAAPLVTFKTINGLSVDLAAPEGKATLISFWSPDCPFSQRNESTLSALRDQFTNHKLDIVAVAMPYADRDAIDAKVSSEEIQYQIAHDTSGQISDAFPGVRFTPTTFLIDSKGQIIWRHVGKLNTSNIEMLITKTLSDAVLASS